MSSFVAVLLAAVTLPHVIGHNMVLQQQAKVPIWGKAAPGEKVTVSFAGQKVVTTAGKDGRWRAELKPLVASNEPRTMTINDITLTNVVVGEVWLCSGQSNMAYPMQHPKGKDKYGRILNWEQERANGNQPMVRHFKIPLKTANEPVEDVTADWVVTTPKTLADQSAVAYCFGEYLHRQLKVPVGLINSSWGGTRIEPWTPAAHPDDMWMMQNIRSWGRPQEVPTVLWNGMMSGVVPFAIKGAIWYQGCANVHDKEGCYVEKTTSMVRGWRREWGEGDFPFYLVQLAPYKHGGVKAVKLSDFQEEQARIPTVVPNSGYVVINDVGDVYDIHPDNKRPVGERLADQALDRTYGKFVREWRSPEFAGCAVEGATMRIKFANAKGLKTRDGKNPTEFELRGIDTKWIEAAATIEGEEVVLSAAGVDNPVAVRFAAYNGSLPNLCNGAGLPAGPFRHAMSVAMGDAESVAKHRGMTCVQRYDIPVKTDFTKRPPKSGKSLDGLVRVGYLLELEKQSGGVDFAYVEMDAYRANSDDMVLTDKAGGARRYRQEVMNLFVCSNVQGVDVKGKDAKGFIEFYDCKYTPGEQKYPKIGSGYQYDMNDSPRGGDKLGYGCLQVHDFTTGKTLMAFNHFDNDKVPCDVGVGMNTNRNDHPDWTFAANAGKFKTRRISVWAKKGE